MLSVARRTLCLKLLTSEVCNLAKQRLLSSCLVTSSEVQREVRKCQSLVYNNYQIIRYKSKGKSKIKKESSSEPEKELDDLGGEIQDKHTKVMNIDVTSLRVDAILKNALGIARNKIEVMFYESKIRVNGQKIAKKGTTVQEGDEIDIIKGYNQNNQDLLVVARVEILGATAKEESIMLKIRRCKSLVIENYEDRWQGKSI